MENLISATEFCANHNIDISFISSLYEVGLIEITLIDENVFIPEIQLLELERMVHFHYELDINLEGIETISHLLQRINEMQHNILTLQNRLRLYEVNEM